MMLEDIAREGVPIDVGSGGNLEVEVHYGVITQAQKGCGGELFAEATAEVAKYRVVDFHIKEPRLSGVSS